MNNSGKKKLHTSCALLGIISNSKRSAVQVKFRVNVFHKPNLTKIQGCTDVSNCYSIHTFTFQNSKLQAEIVFTYLKVQYAKDERGLSVTGEIHHQHTNLLNISHFSYRVPVANDCHVKPPAPGTS